MSEDAKEEFRKTKSEFELIGRYHFTLGLYIRNNFGFYRGNEQLKVSCGMNDPDTCSGIIIEELWKRLNRSCNENEKR
jgi:hypothetical protein